MKTFLSALIIITLPVFCTAETVILKDGTKFFEVIKITEDGDRLSIQTKYGNIFANKADVENLEALGFANKSPARGPKTNGLEFISELLSDGSMQMQYFFNSEKIGTQIFTQSGTLITSDGEIMDGTYKEFYPDGKLKKEKTVIDGQDNGSFKTFYPKGTLQSEAYFINGKVNGGYKRYSDSGRLIMDVNEEPKQAVETPRHWPPKAPEHKPVPKELNSGKSGKESSFFIEGEIFTVGGVDKEWKKNINAIKDVLNSVYDSVTGDLTTYPGLGVTAGINLTSYKNSPTYLAAGYIKGPSADGNITISDSYYGSGSYTEELTTSFYRLLLGYKLVIPMQSNQFFVVDANAGFGGGSINSDWAYSGGGLGSDSGSGSESWTGLTWSIGPTFSWEAMGYIFELGGRYTAFPELTDGDKFSDVKWKPLSIRASLTF